MWERLPTNDGMMEVANKRVSPLAVLAVLTSVMVIEVAASDAKKLEVVARARKAKFKNASANTRVTTWVDADYDGNISRMLTWTLGKDHILLPVLTRELLISGNKQAINMTEMTPLCQDMEDGLDKQFETLDFYKEEIMANLPLMGMGDRVAQKHCKDTSMGKCTACYKKESYPFATVVGEEDLYQEQPVCVQHQPS